MTVLPVLLFPLFSGVLLMCFGKYRQSAQWLNIVLNLIWAVLVVQFLISPEVKAVKGGVFPILYEWNWLPFLKSRFLLGIDGLSSPLIVLNVFLSVCLAFYALGKEKLSSGYLGLFFVLNFASVGSLLAADAFAFYCFWEFMLIPMFFLIGRWGSQNRVYAALKFFGFTMAGSLFMLLAIVGLAFSTSVPSLSWLDIASTPIPFDGWRSLQGLFFLGFLAAFIVKIPVWPFHTWLPDAHTEAPTGGSVILAGVLLKLGVYGIARWCLPLFPDAAREAAPAMLVLGAIGIVLGAFSAWWQKDIKRMIAYSSVSHLGFMVLGLFVFRQEGLEGAMFQNLAHGLSTGALFLIFGIIYDRTHTRKLEDYGGLATSNAWLATFFVVASMASIGLPGLPGFIGEFLILSGTWMTSKSFAIAGLAGVLLGSIYMLTLLRKMLYGPVSPTIQSHPIRLTWNEWVAVIPLIIAMLVLGFGPQAVLNEASHSVSQMLSGLR